MGPKYFDIFLPKLFNLRSFPFVHSSEMDAQCIQCVQKQINVGGSFGVVKFWSLRGEGRRGVGKVDLRME